jgi:hypothetical protein
MNTFPSFRPERAKHVTIHHDWVTSWGMRQVWLICAVGLMPL